MPPRTVDTREKDEVTAWPKGKPYPLDKTSIPEINVSRVVKM
jgi:hypothetical protein